MSIKLLIKIKFFQNLNDYCKKMDFSFWVAAFAIKHKLALNFGANISREFYSLLSKLEKNEMILELLDSPISVDAELLFLGEGVSYSYFGENININESLYSRMSRVQKFIQEILNNEVIEGLSIDIDAENTFDSQDFEKITIKVDEFVDTMVKLFEKNKQMTPTVRINFKK